MKTLPRWLLHVGFWLAYWFIYAYTYSRYDGDFFKLALTEGLQMPARILATYVAFYLLDRWGRRNAWAALGSVVGSVVVGGMLNRLLKWGYVVPVYFPDSTIEFWGWRAMVDIFDVALAAGAALSGRLFFRQQESLRREAQLQHEKTAAELTALKSQVQPHFLFNTINNIYALARMQSDQTAPAALKLANLLRFVLYETRKPAIPLEQEIKILRDYLELEKLRFHDDRLRLEVDLQVTDPQRPITPLLLLPLVENAFKHGAGEQRDDARIHLHLHQEGARLVFSVENTLPESPGAANTDGIGLKNVQRQLELIYPDKSRLDISCDGGIFKVKLQLW